ARRAPARGRPERRHRDDAAALQLHLGALRIERLVGEVPRRDRAALAGAVIAPPEPLDLRTAHAEADAAEGLARDEGAGVGQERGGEGGEQAHEEGILAYMDVFNVCTGATDIPADPNGPPGYAATAVRVGKAIGATPLGMSIYELPPGQAIR